MDIDTILLAETPAETPIEEPAEPTMTKGEVLVAGLNQIDEGLKMISALGNNYDVIATMVGSKASAQRLRDVIKSNTVLYNLVVNMVAPRTAGTHGKTCRRSSTTCWTRYSTSLLRTGQGDWRSLPGGIGSPASGSVQGEEVRQGK